MERWTNYRSRAKHVKKYKGVLLARMQAAEQAENRVKDHLRRICKEKEGVFPRSLWLAFVAKVLSSLVTSSVCFAEALAVKAMLESNVRGLKNEVYRHSHGAEKSKDLAEDWRKKYLAERNKRKEVEAQNAELHTARVDLSRRLEKSEAVVADVQRCLFAEVVFLRLVFSVGVHCNMPTVCRKHEAELKAVQEENTRLSGELQASQEEVRELVEAVTPIVDALVPVEEGGDVKSFLARLRQSMGEVRGYAGDVARACMTELVTIAKALMPGQSMEPFATGSAPGLTEEEYAALETEVKPVADAIMDRLEF